MKELTLEDFKDDGIGWKYEIQPGEKVSLYLDDVTAEVLRENARLKDQRDELLEALVKIDECLNDGILIQNKDPFHNNVIKRLLQKHRPKQD